MKQVSSIKVDKEKGSLMGWESLLLQLDDADTKKQMKEIAGVMGTTAESGTIVTGSIGEAAPKQKIYLVKQDQPHESEGKFWVQVYIHPHKEFFLMGVNIYLYPFWDFDSPP